MSTVIGRSAPDFSMEGVADGKFSTFKLNDFRGKWVVLFFYPLDFTFVCPTEILAFSKHVDEFAAHDAVVLGVSTDSVYSHRAWLKDLGELHYPLLSDANHAASRAYGVLIEEKGIALRGTFIIDPDGDIRYALFHDLKVGRSVSECLRVLAALQNGELCPVEWKDGEATLGKG